MYPTSPWVGVSTSLGQYEHSLAMTRVVFVLAGVGSEMTRVRVFGDFRVKDVDVFAFNSFVQTHLTRV